MTEIVLDVTGKVCPIPAAETRKTLKKAESGTIISIKGDYPPAVENIIKMAEKTGGEILSSEISGDNFLIKIRKK